MEGGSMLDLANNLGEMLGGRRGYDGDGMFGGNGIWLLIILFFIMFAGGGNGFGFGNRGNMNELTNEFLFTNMNNTIDRGFNQLANQNFQIERTLCQSFADVNANIAESRYAAQNCCCETNRNIDAVRYENARNTCDIITAGQANTQKILDYMQGEKIDSLRTELQAAQLQLGQLSQTQTLINTLRPCPIPAYLSCSPYTSYSPYGVYNNGYGYGNGCGCNNNVNLV